MRFKLFALLCFAVSLVGCAMPSPKESGRFGLLDNRPDLEDSAEMDSSQASGASQASKEESLGKFFPPRRSKRHDPVKSSTTAHVVPSGATAGTSGLMWPLRLVSVTSEYGKRGRVFHEGLDLKAGVGTSVYACQSGKVLYSGRKIRGYGKMIVIRHENGLATVYAHNSKLMVRQGDHVIQGQLIALSGATGRAHGPHLHFEVRRGVIAMDPMRVMPLEGAERGRLSARASLP